MAKRNVDRELLKVSKAHLQVSKQNRDVNKEHKEISKNQFENSISRREHRFWMILTILATLSVSFIGGKIYFELTSAKNIEEEKMIGIEVNPSKIILNYKQDQEFKFKFSNVGKINISEFKIYGIELYRFENDKLVKKQILLYPFSHSNDYDVYCNGRLYSNDNININVGETCSLKVKMFACEDCFNDKDKKLQFHIYMKSLPFLMPEIVNLTVY